MSDIFVVGDVHGNYPKLISALETAGYKMGDDIVFVGDLTDRGVHNARVVRFVRDLGEKAHVVRGNHEYQHLLLLPMYQTILSFGKEYAAAAALVFKFFKPGVNYPKTAKDCEQHKCTLEERWTIIDAKPKNFEQAVKQFIVYTLAWENDSMWKLIVNLLDSMCGPPYNAEHTLYEYFSGSAPTREAFEALWRNPCQEVNVSTPKAEYKQVIITHNNPFGPNIYSIDPQAGKGKDHTDILYIFGHIPVEHINEFEDHRSHCKYIDIDLSPKQVGVLKIEK